MYDISYTVFHRKVFLTNYGHSNSLPKTAYKIQEISKQFQPSRRNHEKYEHSKADTHSTSTDTQLTTIELAPYLAGYTSTDRSIQPSISHASTTPISKFHLGSQTQARRSRITNFGAILHNSWTKKIATISPFWKPRARIDRPVSNQNTWELRTRTTELHAPSVGDTTTN